MLCGKGVRNIIEQLQRSISRDLELVDVNPVQRHLVLPPHAVAARSSIRFGIAGRPPARLARLGRAAAAAPPPAPSCRGDTSGPRPWPDARASPPGPGKPGPGLKKQ